MISFNDSQYLKAAGPIVSNDDGISNVTFSNELHAPKEYSPIKVTDDGMTISTKDMQWENAKSSMISTDDGMTILDNDLQLAKALFPIVLIEDGIVTCTNEMQLSKVPSSIDVNEEGMSKLVNILHDLNVYRTISIPGIAIKKLTTSALLCDAARCNAV